MITATSLHSEALASSKPGSQYSTTLHVLVLPVYLNYPYHVSPSGTKWSVLHTSYQHNTTAVQLTQRPLCLTRQLTSDLPTASTNLAEQSVTLSQLSHQIIIYHLTNTAEQRCFITSAHQHTNTPAHQYTSTPSRQHISTSVQQLISTSPHQNVSTSVHQHVSTSAHQHSSTSSHPSPPSALLSHHHIITSSHHHIITSKSTISSPVTSSHHHIITSSHHHIITSSHPSPPSALLFRGSHVRFRV